MSHRFLIFVFGDVGDTLLTVPAIRALRERYPHARLVLLGKQTAGQLLSDLDLVDDVITIDKHLFDRPSALLRPRAWHELVTLLRHLRRERFDTVVILHHLVTLWGTLKYALLSLATGAQARIGLDNGRGWFLTRTARDRGFGVRHEAEYWLDVVALLGARGSLNLAFPISVRDRATVDEMLRNCDLANRPLLAVHPGTGWYGPGRRWPAGHFADAARSIMQRDGLRGVIVGTEQDAAQVAEVARLLGPEAVNLAGRTSLGELGALLQRCSLLVANDGGVAHVSAAVGTPVVSVFGPSNDLAWRPLLGKVVAADMPCRPCFYRDFGRGLPAGCATRECLAHVTPEAVAEAASSLLMERVHVG